MTLAAALAFSSCTSAAPPAGNPDSKPVPPSLERLTDIASPSTVSYLASELEYSNRVAADEFGGLSSLELALEDFLVPEHEGAPLLNGAYEYRARTERGYALPVLSRRAADSTGAYSEVLNLNGNTVGAPGFRIGAFRPSPSGRFIALIVEAGSGGSAAVLCPGSRLDGLRSLPFDGVFDLAWLGDSELLVTTEENGRPSRLHRIGIRSAGCPAPEVGPAELLAEESRPSHSLLVSADRGDGAAIVSSGSWESNALYSIRPGGTLVPVASEKPNRTVTSASIRNGRLLLFDGPGPERRFEFANASASSPGDPAPVRVDRDLDRCDGYGDRLLCAGWRRGVRTLGIFRLIGDSGSRTLGLERDLTSAFGRESFDLLPPTGDRPRVLVTSPLKPPRVLELDPASGTIRTVFEETAPARLPHGTIAAATARTANGEEVPYTVITPARGRDSGITLLSVYGSYGMPLVPRWSPGQALLLDRGISLAFAHVRGGPEGGAGWRQAGRRNGKIVAAGDLVAVARAIVNGDPGRTIAGTARSAGAPVLLLAMRRAPELFAGGVIESPFLDLEGTLRDGTSRFSARDRIEFGDPFDPSNAAALATLDPMRFEGAFRYPPLLVLAALDDDVTPILESVRFLAAARRAHADSLLLLAADAGADHGGARDLSTAKRRESLRAAFLASLSTTKPRRSAR